jgi:hypothetical protein
MFAFSPGKYREGLLHAQQRFFGRREGRKAPVQPIKDRLVMSYLSLQSLNSEID